MQKAKLDGRINKDLKKRNKKYAAACSLEFKFKTAGAFIIAEPCSIIRGGKNKKN